MNEENFIKGHYSTNYISTVKPQERVDTSMNYVDIYKKLAGIEARRMGL